MKKNYMMPSTIVVNIKSQQLMSFSNEGNGRSHDSRGDGGYDDRRKIPAEGEPAFARYKSADITADIRADQSDEHGDHGSVPEALLLFVFYGIRCFTGTCAVFLFSAAQSLEIRLIEQDGKDHSPHDADAHQERDRRKGRRCHLGRGQRRKAYLLRSALGYLGLIMQQTAEIDRKDVT